MPKAEEYSTVVLGLLGDLSADVGRAVGGVEQLNVLG